MPTLLAAIQGIVPQNTHLILGDGRQVSFRVEDFASYVRHARQRFEQFTATPHPDSYPEPCATAPIAAGKQPAPLSGRKTTI